MFASAWQHVFFPIPSECWASFLNPTAFFRLTPFAAFSSGMGLLKLKAMMKLCSLFSILFAYCLLAESASIDDAKPASDLEKVISASKRMPKENESLIAELKKLDGAVARLYAEAMEKSKKQELLKKQQQMWLSDRDRCVNAWNPGECFTYQYRKRVIELQSSISGRTGQPVQPESFSKPKGEYFLSRNEGQYPVCQDFTRNLNQFRHLDFGECNPRLSPKYPQFSRPQWEEIPFDLAIAEKIVRSPLVSSQWVERSATAEERAANQSYSDLAWEKWLKASELLRQAKQLRLWRTRIDVDGYGGPETLIRMEPIEPSLDYPWARPKPPYGCDYNTGVLHLLAESTPNRDVAVSFNRGTNNGSDLIYDYASDRYYRVEWNPYGPAYQHKIGATAGVKMWSMRWAGPGYPIGAGDVCLIDWVPTGHYKPLKPLKKR